MPRSTNGAAAPPPITPDAPPPDLTNLHDPWLILNAMRQIELSERAQHLNPWMDLVSVRPPTERDALIEAGKEVWRYRVATIREHLDKAKKESGVLTIAAATVALDDKLAEMVYRPKHEKPVIYLVHDFNRPDDPPVEMDRLEVGKVTYYPPTSELINKGVVLLPQCAEEYDTDFDLFQDIQAFIETYVSIEDAAYRTLAGAYVLMSWVFDRFDALPYLRAQGDTGTGKTRLIQAIGSLTYRPVMAGGAVTAAPIFRIIDKLRGTLIIDEADFSKSDIWDEVTKILNAGYSKGFSVLRAERSGNNDTFDVAAYNCYGPKLLATRRRFNDAALESRCLSHTMPLLAELKADVPLTLDDTFWNESALLRNRLLLWRFRKYQHVRVDPRARVPGVEPRVNQVIQPLLACIGDESLREQILGMVQAYSKNVQAERRESYEGLVANAMLHSWARKGCPERMMLKTVTEYLHSEAETSGSKDQISDRKVGDIVRRVLGVPVDTRGGHSWLLITPALAQHLAARYGADLTAAYGSVAASAGRPA